MARAEVLMLTAMQPDIVDGLGRAFTLHRADAAGDADALIAAVGPRVRGLVGGPHAPVDRALLARLPRLEIVSSFGVGYETIDVAEARRRSVVVTNTPDVLTDEVADLALGLLLATVRRIPQADRYLRAGRWREGPFPLTASLRGRAVGILGLGRIGRAIARRLDGFGVGIAYHGRRRQADVPYAYHASLVELARAVDVLVIAAPGGPGTDGIVGASVLEALGPDGIVINVARGSIVDEPALVAALRSGIIHAAGLDVFAHEPDVPDALTTLDSVVLLPHVGSGSGRTREAMGALVVENLISWFSGKGPVTPVPETPWGERS